MSFGMAIFSMIAAWAITAGAMLWGVLRIGRRHQPRVHSATNAPKSTQERLASFSASVRNESYDA